ncbi:MULTISPECIES: TraX family protein [Blautia]|mgnify:FL=1|jgi:hypothetical protein|nr:MULTISPECIES: TraX family protein [Blautia]MCQ4743237.1 conjugal transfer protein TraX [Blautia producta]QIB56611.1 hypothetical protein GXM18_18235 [Blautia producta ATCC 27340 = DSM 2950]
MNILYLKIIAMIAMLLDHIAYFFPDLSISLPLHWIGRVAAPIFIFGVVNGLRYTRSKRMYMLRLYLASIVMAVIQMITQIELNFFRTLFVIVCICGILELRKNRKSVSWTKVLSLYIAYQVIVCIVCGYLSSISNAYMESICFYLIPALLGSVFTIEGGLVFVILGIIMYLTYNNKKRLILSYTIFVLVYMFFTSTQIVPIILWKIRQLIPIIGTGVSHGMEYLLSVIIGIAPMDVGGNIFTIQYQWIMILALPLILLYNHQRGKKCKYVFYIFYPVHIILLWTLAKFVIV